MTLILDLDLDVMKMYVCTKNEVSIQTCKRQSSNGIYRQTFCSCDLDLEPMTLMYEMHLYIPKMWLHIKRGL